MKRSHGSGHLYVKHGSYYGRWRGADGRFVNKKIGEVRGRGEKDEITPAEAERGLRGLVEAESRRPATPAEEPPHTVDQVADDCANGLRWRVPASRIARTASRCSGYTSRRRSASGASTA